eukprot:TRINITY_DN8446_c0_g1_i1.p1 TRINITY_DN8446_c0_g1~~TRINITY_DN8446_c0_g1_i1.p1  ORF type:complete len:488 (-),score=120.86 TRINITY_DN8446_c0_g1_i1:306-1769(-)
MGNTAQLDSMTDQDLPHPWPVSILFGFASGMLGITGYETACNYIEAMYGKLGHSGVYEQALWNMWTLSTLYNPAIAFFSLCFMNLSFISNEEDALINHLGERSVGMCFDDWFDSDNFKSIMGKLVSADATIVLLGSTLTAFIGVCGLLTRLTQDNCLPVWFLQKNQWRGTHHRIILTFLSCALGVLGITGGDVDLVSGIYSTAFCCVMTGMALCCYYFKIKCPHVKRVYNVPQWVSVTAASSTILAVICQAIQKWESFLISVGVLAFFLLVTQCTIQAQAVLRTLAHCSCLEAWCNQKMKALGDSDELVYFLSGSETPERLAAVLTTLTNNETSRRVTLMHICEPEPERKRSKSVDIVLEVSKHDPLPSTCTDIQTELKTRVQLIQKAFPEFDITLETHWLPGGFGPDAVIWTLERYGAQTGQLSMGPPGPHFCYWLKEMHGVRILHLEPNTRPLSQSTKWQGDVRRTSVDYRLSEPNVVCERVAMV